MPRTYEDDSDARERYEAQHGELDYVTCPKCGDQLWLDPTELGIECCGQMIRR